MIAHATTEACLQTPVPACAVTPVAGSLRVNHEPLMLEWWSSSERSNALTAWRTLEGQLHQVPVMCCSLWTEIWLTHYGSLVPHRFIVARRGTEVRGIALVCAGVKQFEGPLPVRTVHLGTAGEPEADTVLVERNDVLAFPEDRLPFLMQIVEQLNREGWWDQLQLDGFLEEPPECSLPQLGSAQWLTRKVINHYCDLEQLRQTPGDIITQFTDGTRRTVRKNLREFPNLQVEWCNSSESLEEAYHELIVMHQTRWEAVGQPGVYKSPIFRAFHQEWIQRSHPAGLGTIVRLRSAGRTVGCAQLLFDQNQALAYQLGHIPSEHGLSPGVLLDFKVIETAMQRGYDTFDFMGGDSLHKRRLTNASRWLVWHTARRARLKFAVVGGLRKLSQTVRSWLGKSAAVQSPCNENTPSTSDQQQPSQSTQTKKTSSSALCGETV